MSVHLVRTILPWFRSATGATTAMAALQERCFTSQVAMHEHETLKTHIFVGQFGNQVNTYLMEAHQHI
jgi:hypothetical protein